MTRDIGLAVEPPSQTCTDPQCPFHGTLPVRGQVLEGTIAALGAQRSVVVKRERTHHLPKYERFEKRTSRHSAHLPPCIPVSLGDQVKIAECRPLSKTKHFVVVEAREARLEVRGVDAHAGDDDWRVQGGEEE